MRFALLASLLFGLCACESQRTVYDEFGNEVKEPSGGGGGEKDLTTHMEEKWNASFGEQKTASGVPQSVSNRVSSFQSKLDDAGRANKEYLTKSYDGADRDSFYTMQFSGADKKYGLKEAYSGGMGERIEKELHPAFATESKGIYATSDSYAGNSRYGREGTRSADSGKSYYTRESYYTRDTESGYIESRRDYTPPPRVMTRDEYYGKTVQDTRMMLGRDKDE